MVNIEREGWKELKVGLVGTVIAEEPAAADELSLVRTTAAHYCAVLGDLSTFTPSLNERTLTRLPARASPLMGTAWIWNLADAHFFDSLQIFDWYPARQHLSLAAQAIGLTARIT